MENDDCGGRGERFAAYLADLANVLGDGRRNAPMISYYHPTVKALNRWRR